MKRRGLLRTGAIITATGMAGCSSDSESTPAVSTETDAPGRPTTADTTTGQQTQTETPQEQFPAQTVGDNWQMKAHDAGHTGYNPASSGPQDSPSKLWESDSIGGILPETIFVQDEVICVMDQGPTTNLLSDIHAVSLRDGTHLWQFNLESAEISAERVIGVDRHAVYLYSTVEQTARLLAVSLQDGSEVWSRTFDGYRDHNASWAPEPIIHDGNLVFPGSESPILCVNTENGNLKWKTEWSPHGTGVLAAAGDRVFATDYKHIRAIDIETGNEIASEKAIGSTPIPMMWIGPNLLLTDPRVGYNYNLSEQFVREKPEGVSIQLLTDSGFYGSGPSSNMVAKYSYDLKKQWSASFNRIHAVDANSLYVDEDLGIVALNRANGETRWQYEFENPLLGAVIPVRDKIIASLEDRIIALK